MVKKLDGRPESYSSLGVKKIAINGVWKFTLYFFFNDYRDNLFSHKFCGAKPIRRAAVKQQ